ncbi:MAG: hypothetical protein JWR35_622 [Marmoricola sp.]|nr:hypothetical protein [Marmoricola sp.]
MTTAVAAPARTVDLRSASRVFAAVILPIGPAAIAILRFVMPYSTTDDGTTLVHEVARHQSAQSAVVWLGFIASLTMVPAVIFAGRLVGRHSPRLAAAAMVLMVPAYLTLGWLAAADAAVWFGVRHGIPDATLASMYNEIHPAAGVATGIFVVGHVFGTVLLGIALIRTRIVPLWAGVIIAVSQPLHFTAAVILSSHSLDLVAWGLNAVGFAAVSVAVLSLSDDEWAVPPASESPLSSSRSTARRSS